MGKRSIATQDTVAAICQLMDQRGLQQRDLAIGTGISTSSLSRKLACRQDIQLSELKAIAAFLNVTPECLLRGAA